MVGNYDELPDAKNRNKKAIKVADLPANQRWQTIRVPNMGTENIDLSSIPDIILRDLKGISILPDGALSRNNRYRDLEMRLEYFLIAHPHIKEAISEKHSFDRIIANKEIIDNQIKIEQGIRPSKRASKNSLKVNRGPKFVPKSFPANLQPISQKEIDLSIQGRSYRCIRDLVIDEISRRDHNNEKVDIKPSGVIYNTPTDNNSVADTPHKEMPSDTTKDFAKESNKTTWDQNSIDAYHNTKKFLSSLQIDEGLVEVLAKIVCREVGMHDFRSSNSVAYVPFGNREIDEGQGRKLSAYEYFEKELLNFVQTASLTKADISDMDEKLASNLRTQLSNEDIDLSETLPNGRSDLYKAIEGLRSLAETISGPATSPK